MGNWWFQATLRPEWNFHSHLTKPRYSPMHSAPTLLKISNFDTSDTFSSRIKFQMNGWQDVSCEQWQQQRRWKSLPKMIPPSPTLTLTERRRRRSSSGGKPFFQDGSLPRCVSLSATLHPTIIECCSFCPARRRWVFTMAKSWFIDRKTKKNPHFSPVYWIFFYDGLLEFVFIYLCLFFFLLYKLLFSVVDYAINIYIYSVGILQNLCCCPWTLHGAVYRGSTRFRGISFPYKSGRVDWTAIGNSNLPTYLTLVESNFPLE